MKRRPALRYHGGKWLLASWIISHLPPHRSYVEPYGGGASVLLLKARCYSEIYNDLNGEIVSLFRVLQNPKAARELQRLLHFTPFARAEFKLAYQRAPQNIGSKLRLVEDARRLLIRSFMGFGSAAHNSRHATGFRSSSDRSGTTPAGDWRNYPEALTWLTDRLRGVTIEDIPALELISRHRHKTGCLIYADPPYVHATRKHRQSGNYGAFEMTDADHVELAGALHQVRGMVAISGYDCPLYAKLYKGWRKVSKITCGNGNCGSSPRTEILWLNYP